MYPAVMPAAGLPDGFDRFRPEKSWLLTAPEALTGRAGALAEWQNALSR
jgi:thiamine transport system substrate-binding protein